MREILFKAKRVHNGEWVEGDLSRLNTPRKTAYFINSIEVISETVSQFTGLTDNNGVKIFEGDICIAKICGNKHILEPVRYYKYGFFIGDYPASMYCEVIGNIHDKIIIDFKQLQLETAKNVLITFGKDIKRVREEFNKKQNESDISPTGSVRPV